MLCEQCGENEATVRVEAYAPDGTSAARMLCAECASKLRPNFKALRALDISDFLNALIGKIRENRQEKEADRFDARCSICGYTFADYRKSGVVGCAACYRAFREPIEEVLVKHNGSALYMGSAPDGGQTNDDIYRLKKLKDKLRAAVEQEDFESAARLRDEVRELSGRLNARREE